jgi:hypothetical protein
MTAVWPSVALDQGENHVRIEAAGRKAEAIWRLAEACTH